MLDIGLLPQNERDILRFLYTHKDARVTSSQTGFTVVKLYVKDDSNTTTYEFDANVNSFYRLLHSDVNCIFLVGEFSDNVSLTLSGILAIEHYLAISPKVKTVFLESTGIPVHIDPPASC